MILLDANYVLRFLLKDSVDMYEEAKEAIAHNQCQIPNEVFAEVVFVLQKVYKVEKNAIKRTLEQFLAFDTISMDDKTIIVQALQIFADKNLDYVDALLCAKSKKQTVKTFDKKLIKCIETQKA